MKRWWMGAMTAVVLTAPILYGQQPPPAATVRVLFAGDTAWGESYQDQYQKAGQANVLKEHGYDYTIEKLQPLLQSANVVIANLETPVATTRDSPFVGQKDYIHYADPTETPDALLRHNITVVGLANNHTRDLGALGLIETLDILKARGIDAFGAGRDEEAARRPWHRRFTVGALAFSLYVIGGFEYREAEYDKKFEFYARPNRAGVAAIDTRLLRSQIQEIRRSDKDAFVVFFPHWGENYKWKTDEQTATGHEAVDAGADLVIGHGAHMLQEIERYHGKWIIYSIGNFMFNASGRYAANKVDPFGLPAVLNVTATGRTVAVSLELYPIISDNRITAYQPRLATADEFTKARDVLASHSPASASWGSSVTERTDHERRFLSVSVR